LVGGTLRDIFSLHVLFTTLLGLFTKNNVVTDSFKG